MKLEIEKITVHPETFKVDTVIIDTVKSDGKEKKNVDKRTFILEFKPCRKLSFHEVVKEIAEWMDNNKGNKKRCPGSYLMEKFNISEVDYERSIYYRFYRLINFDIGEKEIFILRDISDLSKEKRRDLRIAFARAFFHMEEGKKKSDRAHYWLGNIKKDIKLCSESISTSKSKPPYPEEENVGMIEVYLSVDILEMEIGDSLIPLVDESQGGDFLDRVKTLRRQIAQELGIIVPPVRIRDYPKLGSNEYTIMIRDNEVTRGELQTDKFLAINPDIAEEEIEGENTIEPACGLNAKWIIAQLKEKAELSGYIVVEPSCVLATHLSEVIKSHANEILTMQDVQTLVDNVKRNYPILIEELIPRALPLSTLENILKYLLNEGVPVRDLVTIIEAVGDYDAKNKDLYILGEIARSALYRTITNMYVDEEGKLIVFTLAPDLEQMIENNMQPIKEGIDLNLEQDVIEKIIRGAVELSNQMVQKNLQPVALVFLDIRFVFKTLMKRPFPKLAVISYHEVVPEHEIISIGELKI